MYSAKTYNVSAVQPYLDVVGIIANDVVVVDRNGIGLQHGNTFSGSATHDIYTYEWFGIRQGTLSPGNYLITLANTIIGTDRVIVYEFGPTPVVNTTYSVYYGTIIAEYRVLSGDNTAAVRAGLKSAIDAQSWGAVVTTTNVGANRLQVEIADISIDLTVQLGSEKFKKGYYTTIGGINYIIVEQESPSAYPILPAIAASYAYSTLTPIAGTVEDYLLEPLTVYQYSDSLSGTANVTGIPSAGNVTIGECVIDQANQKVWFDSNLNFGEIIKIFQK